jgi:hypothetical protein
MVLWCNRGMAKRRCAQLTEDPQHREATNYFCTERPYFVGILIRLLHEVACEVAPVL